MELKLVRPVSSKRWLGRRILRIGLAAIAHCEEIDARLCGAHEDQPHTEPRYLSDKKFPVTDDCSAMKNVPRIDNKDGDREQDECDPGGPRPRPDPWPHPD
ncbi:MAG TPA: hypothetical protein VFI39_08575 [Gemmatimonadales bacterium]|nr:hypothetical protein [Gemmatimonadales bacterium]